MTETKKKTRTSKPKAMREPKVNGGLPLYSDPRPVHSVTHKDVAITSGPLDFSFAEKTPLVALTVDEFERAALDYPIVFFGEDHQPYAVTGLEAERNLFVTDGHYRADAYVPAYLRRYPFVFARDENSSSMVLCVDHASSRVTQVGTEGATALFEGDELTDLTRQAMTFCESYEAAQGRTKALVALLAELNLFEPKLVHYTATAGEEPQLLLEFLTISRDRLDALDAEGFLRLRTGGALPAVYAQVASQAKWEAFAASIRDAA